MRTETSASGFPILIANRNVSSTKMRYSVHIVDGRAVFYTDHVRGELPESQVGYYFKSTSHNTDIDEIDCGLMKSSRWWTHEFFRMWVPAADRCGSFFWRLYIAGSVKLEQTCTGLKYSSLSINRVQIECTSLEPRCDSGEIPSGSGNLRQYAINWLVSQLAYISISSRRYSPQQGVKQASATISSRSAVWCTGLAYVEEAQVPLLDLNIRTFYPQERC